MTGFRALPRSQSPRSAVVGGTRRPVYRTAVPTEADLVVLQLVLSDLRFPVRTWQIITAAEVYGADVHTRERLQKLPDTDYQSLGHVGAVYAGLRDVPGPGTVRPHLP